MKLRWSKGVPKPVKLNDELMTDEAAKLQEALQKNLIDQDRAIKQFVRVYEAFQTGLNKPGKPLSTLLFLGPTGVGKTHLVEVFCDQTWGNHNMILKIDCAEFQHSHEVAKLIGSPPGYVGYNSGAARLSQQILEEHWKDGKGPKISVILFDEIEKAHPDFFQLILGLLEKGKIRLGNGIEVDCTKCVVVLTSNLGAKDVNKHLNEGHIGFGHTDVSARDMDQKIYETSMKKLKDYFQPEFLNRIDRVVVFRALTPEGVKKILDLELYKVQDRILSIGKFVLLDVSPDAKEFLIKEGYSKEYGARELGRAIERFLVSRLTRLFATKQVNSGDMLLADYDAEAKKMVFHLQAGVVDLPPTAVAPEPKKPNPPFSVDPMNTKPVAPQSNDGTERARISDIDKDGKCQKCGKPWSVFHYCPERIPGENLRLRKAEFRKALVEGLSALNNEMENDATGENHCPICDNPWNDHIRRNGLLHCPPVMKSDKDLTTWVPGYPLLGCDCVMCQELRKGRK